jgi:aminopeptidase N
VGDEAFFAFLKDYQSRFRGKLATTADFFGVLREHTRADLTPLLDTYFADPNR